MEGEGLGASGVSRRTVLGVAAGGAAAAALPAAIAAVSSSAGAAAGDPGIAAVPLDNQMTTDTQWSDFLRGQDLLWRRLPTVWHEGPFLGDGRLGTLVYKEPGQNQVRFTVQHSEVQDHRPEFGALFGLARLPVGHLTLEPAGTISSVSWRLGLWNAELTGTITTSAGQLSLQVFIHNQVLVAAVTPSGGERVRWVFHPEPAISPRAASQTPPSGYTGNPPPKASRSTAPGTPATCRSPTRSPRTGPGGTRTTARASCPFPTSGCRRSTGSSSTRWRPARGPAVRSCTPAARGWSLRRGRACGGT